MVTLVNKKNNLVKIIVPDIVDGAYSFIINKDLIPIAYRHEDIYLSKTDWDIIK